MSLTTNTFFTILGLPDSFLSNDPETWSADKNYKSAEKIVQSITVVNDAAERGVKLIQDFNTILTKNEEQKQFLLQVVQEHCKLYPESKKSTVIAGLHLAADNSKDDPSPPEYVDSD